MWDEGTHLVRLQMMLMDIVTLDEMDSGPISMSWGVSVRGRV